MIKIAFEKKCRNQNGIYSTVWSSEHVDWFMSKSYNLSSLMRITKLYRFVKQSLFEPSNLTIFGPFRYFRAGQNRVRQNHTRFIRILLPGVVTCTNEVKEMRRKSVSDLVVHITFPVVGVQRAPYVDKDF